jgi:polysaccharide deacetylase family protein (PEP-CTERM system associated)
MRHAFTVDVEDWFNGIPISNQEKACAPRRLEIGLNRLLKMLAEHRVRATFFVLAPQAEECPELIRRIAEGGHELGCHGWSHDPLFDMTAARFSEETRRAVDVLTNITGKPVTAYRAAYFSITKKSLWALEILAKLGFRYDSSIFPVRNYRYGIADFERRPKRIDTAEGPIYEFPISVRRVLGHNLPVSGGAYFRLYPYSITRANFRAAERSGHPVVFYLHPWELDPEHPRRKFLLQAQLTHYANLCSTETKLGRLLEDFDFGPLGEILDYELDTNRS